MSARAMLNFGLTDLRIVNPRDGWPNDKAIATASGADDVMNKVQVFESVKDAIADLHSVYATTSRARDIVKDVHTPRSAAQKIRQQVKSQQSVGVIFGAERTGVENEDITLADALITYPTNPDFSSLNLAQAVLVMAYEIFGDTQSNEPTLRSGASPLATKDELDNFLSRLMASLEDKGFFKTEEMKPTMVQNIENLFVRTTPTQQELNTLHGVIASLLRKD